MIIGVIVMIPVIGVLPVLVAVNEGTFPVPDAGNPIAGFEFVQLKLTPAGEPAKMLAGKIVPSFMVVSELKTLIEATGVTVTESVAVAVAHWPGVLVNV